MLKHCEPIRFVQVPLDKSLVHLDFEEITYIMRVLVENQTEYHKNIDGYQEDFKKSATNLGRYKYGFKKSIIPNRSETTNIFFKEKIIFGLWNY